MERLEISEKPGVLLDESVVRSFKVAKVFRENTSRINHVDFFHSGDLLISSAEDDQIVIYDCEKGVKLETVYSKKYGVDLIHFTKDKNTVIHSSTKVDDKIRSLSLNSNNYTRYFVGHVKRVNGVCMSPTNETFLSTSLDKTVRLWDHRSENCQGLVHVTGKPVAAFSPDGLIFATGIDNQLLKLYDLRTFDKGPFETFRVACDKEKDWMSLKFSPDGKSMMVGACSSSLIIVDSINGTLSHTFTGQLSNGTVSSEASFSPDSQFVLSGSFNGLIHVWNVSTGFKVCALSAEHAGPVRCVQFNPKFMMMATTCTNMAFWIPHLDDDVPQRNSEGYK